LKSIGAFVAEEFVAIVKGRNQVAKKLGYEDFYDFKVRVMPPLSNYPLWHLVATSNTSKLGAAASVEFSITHRTGTTDNIILRIFHYYV
jgi:hypothetical protein